MHPSTAPPIWAMVDAHWSGERCASAIRGEAVTEASHIGSFRPTQRSLNPSYSASRQIHSDGLITGYMRRAALHNKPDRPPKFLEARTLSAASLATAFTVEIISTATPTKISDICQCEYAATSAPPPLRPLQCVFSYPTRFSSQNVCSSSSIFGRKTSPPKALKVQQDDRDVVRETGRGQRGAMYASC